MKTIAALVLAVLTTTAVTATAQADTITIHGVWDSFEMQKHGK